MNVVAFHASPRAGGNSELLLKEAIRGAGLDVRTFVLSGMNIEGCRHCDGCLESGCCIIEDDMVEVYDAIRAAERIIFSSPVFFMGVPAQAKAMIDRCQAFWCEKYILKRPIPAGERGRRGLVLLVGGMKWEKGISCAEATVTAFLRSISVSEHRTLSWSGVDSKGAILRHPSAMREAFEAGAGLVGV